MAQPPAYTRVFSFSDYTVNHPADQQPGVRLDTEFDAVATTTAAVRANLALIQRDDGVLANNSVGADQISPEITVGLRTVSTWTAGTDFVELDAAWVNGLLYHCLVSHTSAAAFATDFAASKWSLIYDFTEFVQDAVNAAIAAGDIVVGVDTSTFAGKGSANVFTSTNAFQGLTSFSALATTSINTAVTVADYWAAKPTDYGAGKPGVFLRKKAGATAWELEVDDGAGGSGTLDLVGTGVTINGAAVAADADITALETSVRRARSLALTSR